MIPESLSLPEDIEAMIALGDRLLDFGSKLVTVFLGPSEIIMLKNGDDLLWPLELVIQGTVASSHFIFWQSVY
jgi:hypothetical protein